MFYKTINFFYPELKQNEMRKYGLLSIIFFLIIGTYWLLRLLKNTIFLKVAFPESLGWLPQQGPLFQPTAKFWSPFIVLIMVLLYSKLVDLFKKHQLFYIICTFYAIIFASVGSVLLVKEIYGLHVVGKTLLATMGWFSYFAIESFGSLVPALFWSFTNSITDSESAKRSFPLIIATAQMGAIAGSTLLLFSESIGNLWPILMIASLFVFLIVPMVHYFMKTIPETQLIGNPVAASTEKIKEGFLTGFISGLTLLVTRSYLLGVLIISTFYEAIAQIVEYQMQRQACLSPIYSSDVAFAKFQAIYGISINVLSFLIALLGTSYLLKKLGTQINLLIYPIIFGITLLALFGYFQLWSPAPSTLLWFIFAAMVVIKGVGYAVNNPTKEIMYIPTSKDAKFKSKGWIDTFGSRFAKAGGAQITNKFKHSMSELMVYGSMFGFGLIFVWLFAAFYVGKKNSQLLKDGKIIE